jgi:hypothetical protein
MDLDFTLLAPREKHEALKFIATHANFKIKPYDEQGRMIIERDRLPLPPAPLIPYVNQLLRDSTDATGKTVLLVLTSVLRDGPKFFCPTAMQCEAMEHMSMDIEVSDFTMPYGHLIIVLPSDYRQKLKERFPNTSIPRAVVVWEEPSYRIIGAVCFSAKSEYACLIPDRPGSTIEDRLRDRSNLNADSLPVDGEEFDMSELVERVALNMVLVLERDKCTIKPNLRAQEKHLKLRKSKDKKKRELGHLLKLGEMSEVLLDQSIKFYEEVQETSQSIGGTHASPRPHWRRGHHRMQAHGVGRLMRKRIRIKPILVRGGSLLLGQTPSTVVYKSAERKE